MNAPIIDLHPASSDLANLLALLVDPAATQARLDELIAQENSTKEQIAALNEMAGETRRLNTEAQATTIVLNNRKTALDAREAEIEKREAEVEAQAKNLERSEAGLSAASLQKRERAADVKDEALKREADRLAAMRTDLEGRLGQIKNLTATLER